MMMNCNPLLPNLVGLAIFLLLLILMLSCANKLLVVAIHLPDMFESRFDLLIYCNLSVVYKILSYFKYKPQRVRIK